jgi:hypothetical protein
MARVVLGAAAILIGALSLPAGAQVRLEMNQITCRDWLGYDAARQTFVRYWMSGYYSASKNIDVLDFNRLHRNSQKVLAFCRRHKSATLPTAIERAAK